MPVYHPAMDGVVNTEPIMPASSETTIAMMSLNVLPRTELACDELVEFVEVLIFINLPPVDNFPFSML